MKKRPQKLLTAIFFLASFFLVAEFNEKSFSASLTNTSVTLSDARLSFRGALDSGNTVGTSQVIINTTPGDYPSTSSAQLVQGDTVLIGEAGSLGSYTVASTSSESTFSITSALASGDADAADDVIASSSAVLTVRFTTASAINNGTFRILVPALSDNGAAADGIPDGGYWDYGTSTPTVTCPSDIGNYTFGSSTAAASSVTVNGVDYHAFTCPYTGTGAVGTAFDGTTNDAITIDSLINPAPKTDHTTGTADAHRIIVQHLDGSDVVDQTTVSVGVIEAVKVTATVPPQITFRILGLASGTSACGDTTTVTTTPAAVPFGEISIDAFSIGAQGMSVSTNATNGYAVTAIANDQMGKDGATCTGDTSASDCIADTVGDNTNATHAVSDEWTNTSTKGFGYSLDDLNGSTTEAFSYDESARTFSARQFADEEDSQSAQTIFSSSTVADNENLYVCYKIIAASTTEAGNYENYVRYTATATF